MTALEPTAPAVPAGADPDDWEVDAGQQHRFVHSQPRRLYGFVVSATAVQLSDGAIDQGAVVEGPRVWLEAPERGLTAHQARILAAAILEVAEQIDGWR